MDITKYFKSNKFQKDFLASIVVFLVALPLCLGIAIASGVPSNLGLVSGIIGGIVVGILSGCPLQVSGPAAGLISIVVEIVNRYGIEYLGLIIFASGFLQIVFGYMKFGQWFRAVTPAVIYGMLTGIGVLIFASQFHVMVDDLPKENGLQNLLSLPTAFCKGIFPMDTSTHHLAAMIGVITIGIIIAWDFVPKKLKLLPGAVIAVLISVYICSALELPIKYVSAPENLFQGLHFISLEKIPFLFNWEITIVILELAFVASAESLLSTTAASNMSGIRANYNKEMIAQGVGNCLAGFLGALPITGVTVRTAANIQAGAASRLSAILHGIFILLFILFFPWILSKIPIASLAALLVYTGCKLMRFQVIKELKRFGRGEVIIYLLTAGFIVCVSLLEGILIGLVLSIGKLIYSLTYLEITEKKDTSKNIINVFIRGNVSFVNLPKLTEALESTEQHMEVHVHTQDINYIDHACIEFLTNWGKSYEKHGGKVVIEWDELFYMAKKKRAK